MIGSDRILGLVVLLVALAYIASAQQIQTSFMSDPVGPRTFPTLIGAVAAICGAVMLLRPDPDPEWPRPARLGALLVSLVAMVAYAHSLKPFGFVIPTALAAGVLSYQIDPRPIRAAIAGAALSAGLYVLFRHGLDLGLTAFPKAWTG